MGLSTSFSFHVTHCHYFISRYWYSAASGDLRRSLKLVCNFGSCKVVVERQRWVYTFLNIFWNIRTINHCSWLTIDNMYNSKYVFLAYYLQLLLSCKLLFINAHLIGCYTFQNISILFANITLMKCVWLADWLFLSIHVISRVITWKLLLRVIPALWWSSVWLFYFYQRVLYIKVVSRAFSL